MVIDQMFIMVILGQSQKISNDLRRGNHRSNDIADIISSGVSVLMSGNDSRMLKDIQPIYDKLSKINNEVFVKNGGVLGSGEFISIEADERYDGIDEEGLQKLMLNVAALTKLLETPKGAFPTKEEKIAEKIKFILWSALMALNHDRLASDLLKIVSKHASKI